MIKIRKLFVKIAIMALLIMQFAAIPAFACVPHTQGYWKNHADAWPENLKEASFNINLKNTTLVLPWMEVLKTPTRGDAWYILAHQYIAFNLSIAASHPDDYEHTKAYYERQFAQYGDPNKLLSGGPGSLTGDARTMAINYANLLDGLVNQAYIE